MDSSFKERIYPPWYIKSPYYEVVDRGGKLIRCRICERRCYLRPGVKGACWNHMNIDGELYNIAYGLLSAVESRPIEIKPLFHYYPNSTALTFSGYGCNFRCPWCQNYLLSQVPPSPDRAFYMSPRELVREALRRGDDGFSASFNEPSIHFEYLLDLGEYALRQGFYLMMVTNGYFTTNSLKKLVEAGFTGFSIDIKGCPYTYRRFLGADPLIVFRNARKLLDLGTHVEMVYLVVTGANDDEECIEWVIGKHIDYLGTSTPLHINRYYPANKYHEPATSMKKLLKAYEIARNMGIEYVYIGNIVDERYQDTYCPKCGKKLIERRRYRVTYWGLDKDNKCPRCGYKINIFGEYMPMKETPLFM